MEGYRCDGCGEVYLEGGAKLRISENGCSGDGYKHADLCDTCYSHFNKDLIAKYMPIKKAQGNVPVGKTACITKQDAASKPTTDIVNTIEPLLNAIITKLDLLNGSISTMSALLIETKIASQNKSMAF